MNKLKEGGAFPPTDIEGLRPYVDPKSPQALDDESLTILKEVWNPTADGGGDSGGYEALQILAAQYKRNLNAPKKPSIPRWVWLAGAAALVGWYVMRNNKPKGIFGTIEGKTFYAGDLS